MNDWRSMDESDAPVQPQLRISSRPREIVIKGVLATEPESYARLKPGHTLTVGAVAAALVRIMGWGASLTVHLVIFALLMSLLVMSKRDEGESTVEMGFSRHDGGSEGKLMAPPGTAETATPEPEAAKEPPKPEPMKVESPAPAEPVPVASESKPVGQPVAEPKSTPSQAPVAVDPKPATIGSGGGATSAPPSGESLGAKVEKDPSAAVAAKRAGEIGKLKKGKKREIVCVQGAYDKCEDVLDKLGVPHTVITDEDLRTHDLSDCMVLLVNCDSSYASDGGTAKDLKALAEEIGTLSKRVEELAKKLAEAEKRKDRKGTAAATQQLAMSQAMLDYKRQIHDSAESAGKLSKKVRDFVAKGGYLFSSDWGLTLLVQAFPNAVDLGGYVGPKSVRIVPRKGLESHFMLREVFAAKPAAGSTAVLQPLKWEIDGSSYLVKIKDAKVETIIDTPDLASNRSIAVTFLYDGAKVLSAGEEGGRTSTPGRVLHILSHFYNQVDKFGDYGLQNLLVNFLVARVERK